MFKKLIILSAILTLAFSNLALANSNSERFSLDKPGHDISEIARDAKQKPDLVSLSRMTNIQKDILEKRWNLHVKNDFKLFSYEKIEQDQPARIASKNQFSTMSSAPTYTMAFNVYRRAWWTSEHETISRSESTQIIDYIMAKSRMYKGTSLEDSQTDDSTNSDFAAAKARAKCWAGLVCDGSGTAYGNNEFRLSGYETVTRQYSEEFDFGI